MIINVIFISRLNDKTELIDVVHKETLARTTGTTAKRLLPHEGQSFPQTNMLVNYRVTRYVPLFQ